MAWTAPMTAVANAAFTAAQFNTHVRDNLNETTPAKATAAGSHFIAGGLNSIVERFTQRANVGTSQNTTSTSFTDLSTSGPAVTVDTSTGAMIIVSARLSNNTGGQTSEMSFAISGASSIAAATSRSLSYESSNGGDEMLASFVHFEDAITTGSNVFTAKYRVTGGTGTFGARLIIVMPF